MDALRKLDRWLDGVTMYRLTVYTLLGLLGFALLISPSGRLPFTATELLVQVAILVAVCVGLNKPFARLVGATPNPESPLITALILALIINPGPLGQTIGPLLLVAVAAIGSKYLFAWHRAHLFNPAAFGAVIGGLLLGSWAGWWVGSGVMLIPTLIGAGLLLRRIRRFRLALTFLLLGLVGLAISVSAAPLVTEWRALINSPLIFFAAVMLTEPQTTPAERWQLLYAAAAALLFISPALHLGISLAPEEALLAVNLLGWLLYRRARYQLPVRRVWQVARDTLALRLAKPPGFTFRPGQYVELTLPHQPRDSRGQRRFFSLASAPTESELLIAVRQYQKPSTFKQALAKLQPGAQLELASLAGEFTLPSDPARPLVLIAGGIGITPFRSMIKDLLDRGESRTVRLLYAATTPADFAFTDDLAAAERIGLQTECVASQPDAGWPGTAGRITGEVIERAASGLDRPLYYISGSQTFVDHSLNLLRGLGVAGHDIKLDYFPGLAS